jgi:hypothetical protein
MAETAQAIACGSNAQSQLQQEAYSSLALFSALMW